MNALEEVLHLKLVLGQELLSEDTGGSDRTTSPPVADNFVPLSHHLDLASDQQLYLQSP